MTTTMIYMKVTMGGVWVLEQKTKKMKMSALWQRFKKKDDEIQTSKKPSNLKRHLVKSNQDYYAKPWDLHPTFQEICTFLQNV